MLRGITGCWSFLQGRITESAATLGVGPFKVFWHVSLPMLKPAILATFIFGARHIDELSGGELQRVALARTLAPKPRLFMLDEPLSSLDRVLRKRLLLELAGILSRLNITIIFVTHDHEEAFAAGNRVIIMNQGKIEQAGTPEELSKHRGINGSRIF